MIREIELVDRLQAQVELSGKIAPERLNAARQIIRSLAPTILKIIREEVAQAKREACL